MSAPTWARITGAVMWVCGAWLLAATLAVGLGAWEPTSKSVIVECPAGLVAVRIPSAHPCPPPS